MDQTKFNFYDKIVSLEKKVVIVDIGYKYTKFGICGDPQPRCIIPTIIKDTQSGKSKNVFKYDTIEELYNNLVDFFYYLYFKRILLSPKDTKVIIVESLLTPIQVRETLAKVLFCHMQISYLLLVPSHMVALYTLAVSTGLVLDIGYKEACLIPVYEGYPVLHAYQSFPLGGLAVEKNIKRLLMEHYEKEMPSKLKLIENLTEKQLEDIKVRLCFVTTFERAQQILENKVLTPPPSVEYRINGTELLTIPGKVRETAFEVLFDLDADEISLPTMILNSLVECATDMRKSLSESILLIGGTASTLGIKSRMLAELKSLIKMPKYSKKLYVDDFKMHESPSHENYTAWLGGKNIKSRVKYQIGQI
ncbi:conserved hypothetical protein [Pediculus humanus corporis]|uniref:Actin-related protein 10 n=1 Tax=Pediculus humanus subsp. corporis TaxID=121224 RepID=E0VJW4_PEDHC|nr:uncharacterized protein Phum_PHUM252210 [Pediculus humanus corporis]EEB13670.1 conserved hypothetical protein [Pediculus humanus corporis]